MPRYEVQEKRSFSSVVVIDAKNSVDAANLKGEIVSEWDDSGYNSVGEQLLSCELVPDDYEG